MESKIIESWPGGGKKVVHLFNEDGVLTHENTYNPKGWPEFERDFDSNGEIVHAKRYSYNHDESSYYAGPYDVAYYSHGKIYKESHYDQDGIYKEDIYENGIYSHKVRMR